MSTKKLTMVEALNLALREELQRDKNVMIFGEDVGIDGGVFRVTKGLIQEFGKERVIDTPLAEACIIGSAFGLAVYGKRPVCEIQFSGFMYEGFHQIESHVARIRARTYGALQAPMVIRAPYSGGIKALEHHSESKEMYYVHTPGLVVIIPSGPKNARSLMKAAIRANDPVIFLEPKSVYRAFREEIDLDQDDVAEIGKAQIVRPGSQVTVVTYGAMLYQTKKAIQKGIEAHNWDPEVIDLQTLSPMDTQTIIESVKKTGRCVIVHEAHRTGGIAAEIIARVMESAFLSLQAPIERVTGWDTQVPYFARENVYIPDPQSIENAIQKVLNF
ncbi:MAG: 2-oxoisovalerate dehydrogenase [Deltaproteobacteria bacterium RIFCSPHIGHO2_02_FULL_40_11]|nr:MAG: 2-oxoisovalerate dehydrogenase [Deltaproteobacteria bacterium RIFCSPHIGHO2_02_FULL_40_11]